ncbi:MAG: hydroxymethylbilane synthase [Elusimicrobia bacterium]|nr:hydroxymethylbilane synthase [Elusimicrobiota bacterium]MDE2237110.1 hydroxymethylbilane synthase [Elusimicrobiota bacterium]MDE2426161.1 hydroxymethylbilane synthase [Elusimicrobiota bacterium]
MKLRMGTRGSALALAQSGQLARRLMALTPGLEVETVVIKTSGDRFSALPPAEAAARAQAEGGGAKGLFVKEIEEALSAGRVDFAVHSGKDLPARLAAGLAIAAYPAREEPRDAFVGKDGRRLADLPAGSRVASSSLRRRVQLLAARPDLVFVEMRGNVDTRLRKMAAGSCEGLLLAEAGLRRLGRAEVARELLPVDVMVPSPAQGALAVEVARDGAALPLLSRLDDAETREAVEFERAVLGELGGGCSTPLGVFARPQDDFLAVEAFLSRGDGGGAKRLSLRVSRARWRQAAAELARDLRSS